MSAGGSATPAAIAAGVRTAHVLRSRCFVSVLGRAWRALARRGRKAFGLVRLGQAAPLKGMAPMPPMS